MRKCYILTLAALFLMSGYVFSQKEARHQKDAEKANQVNTRVDNNGYWIKMAARGLATLNPVTPVKQAVYVGSEIRAFSVITEDSPDVPVASEGGSTQSENSIFVNPNDNQVVVNSNNSTPWPVSGIYGANSTETYDGGLTWDGSVQGAGGSNSGDPVALIGLDGAYYIGAISNPGGQQVAKSTDQGATYTKYTVSPNPGDLADKNHMWIDNSPVSLYSNNLYCAWTDFGGPYDAEIAFSYSTNGGENWTSRVNISGAINAGSHNQGVNIHTGPNGEVYVCWAVYDNWPNPENTIGFARSFDGGATFEPASRAITNIKGIRNAEIGKNQRIASFPSMAVDISNGEYSGTIYIVWANQGVPGINSGTDVDIYIVKSEDMGETWSTAVRINQDDTGLGIKHYYPWITCDPENGILSVVFYDDRNVGGSQVEAFCANSSDGGETWEDFKVSDVAFTPSPIPGLASGYMGDYLGISARGGWVYPVWADNRTGTVMSYCSPYETNPLNKPMNLVADVPFETGLSSLVWSFESMPGFSYFKIYRDTDSIGTTTDMVFSDQLPDYGIYLYQVTAIYEDGKESAPTNASVKWGDAQISVAPLAIEETIMPDSSVTRMITVSNIGQLEMNYNISMFIPTDAQDDVTAYCTASGTCDEFISRVQLAEIDNLSGCTNYGNYTDMSTTMSVGNSYFIFVTNGNPVYPDDQCGLWIDWNQNEEFDDDEMIPMDGSPGVGPYTATITPPVGAKAGETRMRTRIVYYQTPEPCGATTYGEVEDYTINVISWLTANPITGTVPVGEDLDIAVLLSAAEMELGDYYAELSVYSNDPDDPEIVVPITMHVAEVAVNVNADNENLCIGESATITSVMTGGSGTFMYTWTSDPAGFSSVEANITVTPDVTTTYFVEVFDGSITVADQITIQVNPLPVVSVGADTTICFGDTVMISAEEGFASYLWNTGDTTMTIEASEFGTYSVVVTSEFGCVGSDDMILLVLNTPEKPVVDGPTEVDNYMPANSTYVSQYDVNANSYEWTIIPAEAGSISSDGPSAEVVWASGYTGTVAITAQAMNDCFTSEISQAFATQVYSSAGIGELSDKNQIIIYPNPTDGKITMRLPLQKTFTGDLIVSDGNGATVLTKNNLTIPAGETTNLDLGQMSKGVYSIKLSSNTVVFFGRIVIK